MNNSSTIAKYVDPDPTSALFLSVWLVIVGIFGIPLNIFIVVVTVKVQEIRAVSSNMFIGSLALSDALFLLSISLHLPYALTYNEPLCKVIGFGVGVFGVLSVCHPALLALNRYAIVCRQQEKLAQYMYGAFSRKGTYWMIILLWAFESICQLPFIIFDTMGLHSSGVCTTIKKSANNVFINVYYFCSVIAVGILSNFSLLIFYRMVSSWVKTMSAQLSLSVETKQTIRETKNVLLLTKWVTIVPLIFSSPVTLSSILYEFNFEIVSVGVARLIISSYPLIPLLNAIITLKYASPYRLSFKKICERTKLTSVLFSWVVEGLWRCKVDVVNDNHSFVFAARD